MVGIFCVARSNVDGARTSLYSDPTSEEPLITKVLQPGEALIVNDRRVYHGSSLMTPADQDIATGKRPNTTEAVTVFCCSALVVRSANRALPTTFLSSQEASETYSSSSLMTDNSRRSAASCLFIFLAPRRARRPVVVVGRCNLWSNAACLRKTIALAHHHSSSSAARGGGRWFDCILFF